MKNKIEKIAAKTKELLEKDMTRKSFLKTLAAGAAVLAVSSKSAKTAFAQNTKSLNPRTKKQVSTNVDLAAITGTDIEKITRRSVELLGGMGKFVKKGDVVSIKPNMSWNLKPEFAVNTNPVVVATAVKMCFEAGAKTVKVFDNTLNDKKGSYENSGIMAAAKAAGATVFYADDWRFASINISDSPLTDLVMIKDAVDCDVFISIPIAKHHGSATLSLSQKNLIGVIGGNRGKLHWDLDKGIYDINNFVKPDLCIIDANKILTAHGPSGGDLKDVAVKNTVVASADLVLADSYSAKTFFNKDPKTVSHINYAANKSAGKIDLTKATIKVEKI